MRGFRNPDTRIVVCLGLASVLVNVLVVAWVGISRGGDSFRYVDGAAQLIAGEPLRTPNVSQYLGYVGLVALATMAGTGLTGVVAVQIAMAALAAMAVYDLGRQLGGRLAGTLAAGVVIVDVDIAQWHAYILTDSLYISLVVIATWFVHRAVSLGAKPYVNALLVGVVTASIRPNGWMFGPLAAVYWISRSTLSRWARVGIAGVILASLAGVISIALYQRYNAVVAHPPRGWDNTRAFADVWLGLFGSAPSGENRLALAANRVVSELGHVRPTFSARHNAAVIAALAVTYPLAMMGFIRRRHHPLSRLLVAVIAGHLIIVALTFADRDGRYLLYVFPLIVVFAACGATSLVASASSNRQSPAPPAHLSR
jgi:hypothetical protein